MPYFPTGATIVNKSQISLSFVDWQGERASVLLEIPSTSAANTSGIAGWSQDVAEASNAALLKRNVKGSSEINPAVAEAFDEANASVYQKANLVFQNDDLETVTFAIPAPDASIFAADRKTVDPANTLVAAIISTTLILLNGTGGTDDSYAYVRGYASSYSNRGSGSAVLPTIVEPGETSLPPGEPAEPEAP